MTRTLVALVGGSPAIVTESLWALFRRGEPLDRITHVLLVCTEVGARKVSETLLAPDGPWTRLENEWPGSCPSKQHLTVETLRDANGQVLSDIRTTEDNEAASRQILNIVQSQVDQSDVLHGVLTGGRKTLALFLALGFQFYGRPQDRLYHVLVPESAERNPDFYFPTRDEPVAIDLAEIPYPRLRQLIPDRKSGNVTLSEIVQLVSTRLDLGPQRMCVKRYPTGIPGGRATATVQIGDTVVPCRAVDALIWGRFAERRSRCRKSSCTACEDCFLLPGSIPQSWAPWVTSDEKVTAEALRAFCSRIRAALKRSTVPPHLKHLYEVRAVGRRGDLRYGLALDPSCIEFAE